MGVAWVGEGEGGALGAGVLKVNELSWLGVLRTFIKAS